ncbi:MAG TPA: DUF4375 domain-containing protein [Bacteroidales bacterium]
MRYLILGIIILIASSCLGGKKKTENESIHGKIGTYDEIKKELQKDKVDENSFPPISANIDELEMEINNGGFNQYFFNSSGQNCFATLRLLETKNDDYNKKLAMLLKKAIQTINVKNLTETDLINKIRLRKLESLENESVKNTLDSLDNVYYGH